MQSAWELRLFLLHGFCISYESGIQSNRVLTAQPGIEIRAASKWLNLLDRRATPEQTCWCCRAVSPVFQDVLEANVTDFCYRSAVLEEFADRKLLILNWLPPRDSNPDMLIQSQLSC